MGFAQWFWRLFLIFAGLIAVHAVLVTIVISASLPEEAAGQVSLGPLWLASAATIAVGAAVIALAARRITQPLAELSRYAQSVSAADGARAVDEGDELGVLTGAFSQMQRDLAQRVEQTQLHSQRLQAVLGSMAEGVLAVGPDKTILLANGAARQLLDFATPNPTGRPLVAVTRARPVLEAVDQALASPDPVEIEFDAPGLARRTLSLRATRLPGDPCPGVMVVLHDMTDLRRLENLRRELVANVSHELKTPLAAIKGYAETLRLGAVNDPEHNLHFVQRIEEQADRLHELILDILQLARIESGEETFELEAVPLAPLFDEMTQQFGKAAIARQIQLAAEPPPGDVAAWADKEGVRTILTNLVDNAIKYTPAGGKVTLRVRTSGERVAIEVADTGIGIAEKDQARVFERFYRVDRARSRELGGTGLGLSIVKHLAQALGGSVGLESELGRGTTFRIELPRAT